MPETKKQRSPEDQQALRELGRRIRVLRAHFDIPQDEVGRRAGIGKSHISRIERGDHNVSFLVLVRIAAALGVDPGVLISAEWRVP